VTTPPNSGVPKHASPSAAQLPPMTGNFSQLIYDVLKEKSNGLWLKRFAKEFENHHKMAAPEDIVERVKALPFVRKEV